MLDATTNFVKLNPVMTHGGVDLSYDPVFPLPPRAKAWN